MITKIAPEVLKEKALKGVGKLPPFSPVLTKVLSSLTNQDVMISELAAWVEKDTVLTGTLMKMVNSAAYGFMGRVASIPHAITMLGTNRLRNMVLSLSVCNMTAQIRLPQGWSTKNFNLHAVAVANMSDLIAQNTKVDYPEGAFVAGLLHDIGKLLLAVSCPEEYRTVIQEAATERRPYHEVEMEILGFTHAEMSQRMMENWKLPIPIQMAGRMHHDPDPEGASGGLRALCRAVRIADLATNSLAITAVADGREPADAAPYLHAFGLGERSDRILKSFHRDMEAIRAIL